MTDTTTPASTPADAPAPTDSDTREQCGVTSDHVFTYVGAEEIEGLGYFALLECTRCGATAKEVTPHFQYTVAHELADDDGDTDH